MARFGVRALVITLLVVLPGLAPLPQAGAQSDSGRIWIVARDAYTGMKLQPCATATSHNGGEVYDLKADDVVPVGMYDVSVVDCQRDVFAPVTIRDVEVKAWSNELWSTVVLAVPMSLERGSAIAGLVVDRYSGYPVEQACVQLLDPHTGEIFAYTRSDDRGLYQLFVDSGTSATIRVTTVFSPCNTPGPNYQVHFHPDTVKASEAQSVTTREGEYLISHFRLLVDGGFVGRALDPSGEVGANGYCIWAYRNGSSQAFGVRADGSFTIWRTGAAVSLRFKSCNGSNDYEDGFLTDPANPARVATWNVSRGDVIDLGWIGLSRPAGISGRVVDQFGVPVHDATVHFYAADAPATDPDVVATTDENGWFVTLDSLVGEYTAAVMNTATGYFEPIDMIVGAWLGDTAEREQADTITFTGASTGGIEFTVARGEDATFTSLDFDQSGPRLITTDYESDGATAAEPLEISVTPNARALLSVATSYAEVSPFPGFVGLAFAGTVIYDPPTGSPALPLDFVVNEGSLRGLLSEMKATWNGRLLPDCASSGPPCMDTVAQDARGDIVLSASLRSGGEAAFVWGPRFLDTGGSIFLNDIEWLADVGVTKGCSPPINDLYCPTATVTRGQMAAFLVRYLGLVDRGSADFIDDDDSVFEADIEKLAAAGITRGCNPPANDRFCPSDAVTREQMAAFLSRALNLEHDNSVGFSDDDQSIFEADIERLAAAGITRGCNPPVNDHFCPGRIVTREQMAAFLHRAGSGGVAGGTAPLPGDSPASLVREGPDVPQWRLGGFAPAESK